ncbi:Zinc finger and BTB domain-containing protein 49 [Folsomia candida]|uniref:Zinc finger and BTB domain-containing protein 49 n=1 Tax=Folsomia candida TaxID=158441 RepID=A0A226D516_FOLCA|nr:Zinc finger and BTB domain-containing protein 49 [Folsomia candida]
MSSNPFCAEQRKGLDAPTRLIKQSERRIPRQTKDDVAVRTSVTWCPQRCPVCFKQCKSRQGYQRHVRTHRSDKAVEISCPLCQTVFKKEKYLKRHNLQNKRKPAGYSLLEGEESGDKIMAESSPHEDNICPVATCRRSFEPGRRKSRNSHILEAHATWDGKCVMCELKLNSPDDIIGHMKEEHGPPDKFYEENLVRVKTEVILEDVKIKEEPDLDFLKNNEISDNFHAQNPIPVKTEVVQEDVKSGCELGSQVKIKQEVVPETELGLLENEISVDKIKQEICDVRNVKCEPDQVLHYNLSN